MPIYISTTLDTVAAFQVSYGADRPNVIRFNDTTVTDTLILCANPPDCTEFDTTIQTLPRVQLEDSATLSESWDYLFATIILAPTNLKITAISDFEARRDPPGVLPLTSNETLIRFAVQIECHPDQFGGNEAILQPNLLATSFSTPQGQTISPIASTGATITVLEPVVCDLDFSGSPDALDLGLLIQCLFYNSCPLCDAVNTDFNCDGQTDALDLNVMIEYLFFGAAAPTPCP